jgi:DNA polymerase I
MKKTNKNIRQQALDIFQPLEKFPDGYHNYMVDHTTLKGRIFGMDTETEGLSPYIKSSRIISVGVSPTEKVAYSLYLLDPEHSITKFGNEIKFGDSFQRFINLLNDPNAILVGHNIKYDANWIAVELGITIKCMLFDTMFAQYLLDENIESNSLNYLTGMFADLKGYKDSVNRSDLGRMSKSDLLLYQCKDADASRRLYDYFVPKLRDGGYDKLMTTASMVLPILSKMEVRGVLIDVEYANKTKDRLFKELVASRYTMSEISSSTFNPDSNQSLGGILYKTLGFTPTKFTPTGNPSTDSEAIGYLVDQAVSEKQNKFLDEILRYKKKVKLITTYYEPITQWVEFDGRRHTNYSLGKFRNEEGFGGTVTGRLSSDMQQIPRDKEVKGMFIPTPGYTFLDGDFSQLELRVAAFLSQEPVMMEAFNNGLDIHSAVMSDLTGMPYDEIQAGKDTDAKIKNNRVAIKRVNFGILYGVQARRLQRLLRIELGITQELEYCQTIIRQWLNRYKKISSWIESQKIQAASYKFVTMPLGQRRRLPEASLEHTKEAAHALAQATNFPVQSLASWICLIGLIILDNYWEVQKQWMDAHTIMQVHDSVTSEIKLIESPYNLMTMESIKAEVKAIMETETLNYLKEVFGVNFNVPLVFDTKISERWS